MAGRAGQDGSTAHDPTDVNRTDKLRIERIRDIILAHLARTPAGRIKEAIIDGEVDVRQQGRDGLETFRSGGNCVGSAGSAGISITFFTSNFPFEPSSSDATARWS